MQIIRYNPIRELQKMERELDNLWGSGWAGLPTVNEASTMDLYEEDGNLVAEVTLPHYKKNEITVTAHDGTLEVSAEHKEEEEKKDKRHYYFHESHSQYYRHVALPDGVNTDAVDASFKDGVLKIKMPMEAPKQTKAIDIK